jgi:hypothetical protein
MMSYDYAGPMTHERRQRHMRNINRVALGLAPPAGDGPSLRDGYRVRPEGRRADERR